MVRRLIAGCCLAMLAAGCTNATFGSPRTGPRPDFPGDPAGYSRPYAVVTAGLVHAVVPRHWEAAPIEDAYFPREGIVASPSIDRWDPVDGSVPGVEAEWIDVAHGGIPSDFYYLAARGPAIPLITRSKSCERHRLQVIVNHRPSFEGTELSASDYAVHGTGTCRHREGRVTRYAYFVAAPGFGPVRKLGIPNSGLYVVLAVVRNGPHAAQRLHELLMSARFDDTTVGKLLGAARRSGQLR